MKNQGFLTRMKFALSGIAAGFGSERSVRTQVGFAVLAVLALLLLRPAPVWWALVGVMVVLVLAAELFNTALEHLADHLHPEQHPEIKIVKDAAAGAVLLLSIGALWVAAWMLIALFA